MDSTQAGSVKLRLEKWGQQGERIKRMRDAADFAIYTPGSTAGIPISVLKSFDPPQGDLHTMREDRSESKEDFSPPGEYFEQYGEHLEQRAGHLSRSRPYL